MPHILGLALNLQTSIHIGGSVTNVLSVNLLNNLANYTGKPPHLRIGGNTGDYMIYVSSHESYDVIPNPDPIGQGNFPTDSFDIRAPLL